jgi:hypothetical protein
MSGGLLGKRLRLVDLIVMKFWSLVSRGMCEVFKESERTFIDVDRKFDQEKSWF